MTSTTTRTAYQRTDTPTERTIASLVALGHVGHIPYTEHGALALERKLKAQKRDAKLVAQKGIESAWQRGENLLAQGYSVHAMPEPYCYRVDRPRPVTNPDDGGQCLTDGYHVCLDADSTTPGCDCPDFGLHGDTRPCKHTMAARVAIWQWAQANLGTDYSEYLGRAGVLQMRMAHEALKKVKAAS